MRCRLALVLLLLCLIPLGAGRAAAQELRQDELSIEVEAGYGVYPGYEDGFALPVANSSLGRDWAGGTGFSWQVGRNYSTVPIRLHIEHRFAYALRGTLEVISAHGTSMEEDPLGHLTILSRELLVPPSVPTTIVLTPRVCPPSQPGGVTRLHLRLYLGASQTPQWERDVEAVQLEPAHLYSLYLGGPEGGISADPLNPGNRLGLAWPYQASVWLPAFSFNHYILSQEREQVTLAPLAARDWAFVIADLAQVAGWTAAEQAALGQFMLGGGRLCLCGTGGRADWQGLPLNQGPQPVGRGFLLPVQGGIDEARRAMTAWLEGELEEFAVFTGGTVRGQSLALNALDGGFSWRDRLMSQYAPPAQPAEVVSHRASFLNPVVAYRELGLAGALEPWDYPEISLDRPDAPRYNANLREAVRNRPNGGVVPLVQLARPPVKAPTGLYLTAGLLPLLMLLGGIPSRRRWLALGATALGLAGALAVWWGVQAQPSQVLRLTLWDEDTRAQGAVQRELAATLGQREGGVKLSLASGALLRQVGWQPPGNWVWSDDGTSSVWEGADGGRYATLASEAVTTPGPDCPVSLVYHRLSPTRVQVELDTSRMSPDDRAWLVTPLGLQAVSGGQPRVSLELDAPWIAPTPGLARLQQWEQALAGLELNVAASTITRRQQAFTMLYAVSQAADAAPSQQLARLAQLALLENPGGRYALLNPQAVLLAPVPGGDGTAAGYVRLTFPLSGPEVAR